MFGMNKRAWHRFNYKNGELVSMSFKADCGRIFTPTDFENYITDLYGIKGDYCYIGDIKFIGLAIFPNKMMGISRNDFLAMKSEGTTRFGVFDREEILEMCEFINGNYPRV
jgi:hypothetical protein